MFLYLIRHADAGDADPTQWADDRQRPLSEDGAKKFRQAAKKLSRLVPSVDVVLSSSWVRAWQTAKILEEDAGWVAPKRFEALEGGGEEVVIKALKPYMKRERIALVGHEPTMSGLVSWLIAGETNRSVVEMKKGSVACVEIDSLQAGTGTLKWLLTVKVMREL